MNLSYTSDKSDKSGVKEAQVELFRQAVAELDDRIQHLIADTLTS